MNAETYRRRKQDGVCTSCGGTTVYTEVGFGSKTRCLRCAARDTFYRERRYRKCINRGICVRCGKRPARENRMTCAACAKRQQATYLKRLWGTEQKGEKHDQLGTCGAKIGVEETAKTGRQGVWNLHAVPEGPGEAAADAVRGLCGADLPQCKAIPRAQAREASCKQVGKLNSEAVSRRNGKQIRERKQVT